MLYSPETIFFLFLKLISVSGRVNLWAKCGWKDLVQFMKKYYTNQNNTIHTFSKYDYASTGDGYKKL
jgi:hypothetical protein